MKDLNSELNRLSKNKDINEKIELSKLFPAKFMMKFTKFQNVYDFISNSPFETPEGFEKADKLELDKYVSEVTHFNTWDRMKEKAGSEYLINNLFKK